MSSLKRWLLLLITVLVTIGACGCMVKDKQNSAEQMRTQALEYLNSRYSDEFTAKGYSDKNWAYKYQSIRFSSEKFPDAVVEVRAYENDDGSFVFKDNYYQCYMMDEAVGYLEKSADLGPVCVKVRFSNAVWSDTLKDAETFEQWVEQGTCQMDSFLISASDILPEAQTAFVEKMASNKISGSVVFITTDQENLLADKTLDEILNNQGEFVAGKTEYYINSNFEVETN